jgi:hypothetical protein
MIEPSDMFKYRNEIETALHHHPLHLRMGGRGGGSGTGLLYTIGYEEAVVT